MKSFGRSSGYAFLVAALAGGLMVTPAAARSHHDCERDNAASAFSGYPASQPYGQDRYIPRQYVPGQDIDGQYIGGQNRPWYRGRTAEITAGGAAAGALIGGLARGGKGALVGGIIGGAGGYVYDRMTRNKAGH